jgi:hypothetical protein
LLLSVHEVRPFIGYFSSQGSQIFHVNFQRVEQAKRLSEDKMAENLQWYRPRPLDVKEIMERGANSQEKISQVC